MDRLVGFICTAASVFKTQFICMEQNMQLRPWLVCTVLFDDGLCASVRCCVPTLEDGG